MGHQFLLTAKALHIIFAVAWFAGLFYMPRLLIYIRESSERNPDEYPILAKQLKIMAKRLWYIITWPACIIALLCGICMLVINPAYMGMSWMQLKLGLVFGLFLYHLSVHFIYRKMRIDVFPLTAMQLRYYNELATLLLFAIVFTAVFRSPDYWHYGVVGILILGIVLNIGVKMYKRSRQKRGE